MGLGKTIQMIGLFPSREGKRPAKNASFDYCADIRTWQLAAGASNLCP
ncbi:hypothetical protein ADICYQ_5251 [Cyclobacterium qasimii M12-11B]|uniref:Uncharacterized protein n=1 Tax=Cyclobacterium qasimii M12-11B TaxID=641524 RepID=S7WNL3_9BACT|nr:hypothetical protein ADICYQ_5251 [Cyclobacterium qasimii M12-11B]